MPTYFACWAEKKWGEVLHNTTAIMIFQKRAGAQQIPSIESEPGIRRAGGLERTRSTKRPATTRPSEYAVHVLR